MLFVVSVTMGSVATYAIGDIHGCWQTLRKLLESFGWDPAGDRLYLVGDLVNRGPGSLEVLRWAFENRGRLKTVLGNHDLHLLARAAGCSTEKPGDTLDGILAAPDRDQLLSWLRSRPFVFRDGEHLLVHAGLWPGWGLDEVERLAGELAAALRGPQGDRVIEVLAARTTVQWSSSLNGLERLRNAGALLTRVRTVASDGNMCPKYTGPPESAPEGCTPWFRGSRVFESGLTVIFGHWAQLGFYRAPGLLGLDSGCVWGGTLTAVRLEDGRVFQQRRCDLA